MLIGAPSVDPIIVRDEMHRTMMERGSKRLRQSIEMMRSGHAAKEGPRDLMWLMPFENGRKVRAAASPSRLALFQQRDPCAGCGVRADRHAESGCANYKRGRAA